MAPLITGKPWPELSQQEKQTALSFISVAVVLWSLAFLFLRFVVFRKRTYDFSNRAISLVHFVIAMAMSPSCVDDWGHPLAGIGGPNTAQQGLTVAVSLSYFCYDMIGCCFDVNVDIPMLVHHVATILGLVYGFFIGRSGAELILCLWLMEVSNPFMHLRKMFKELGVTGTITVVNDVIFAVIFSICRMVIGPFVVKATLEASSPLPVKVGAVGIQAVSTLWFYQIVKVIAYKLGGKSGSKKKNGKEA